MAKEGGVSVNQDPVAATVTTWNHARRFISSAKSGVDTRVVDLDCMVKAFVDPHRSNKVSNSLNMVCIKPPILFAHLVGIAELTIAKHQLTFVVD